MGFYVLEGSTISPDVYLFFLVLTPGSTVFYCDPSISTRDCTEITPPCKRTTLVGSMHCVSLLPAVLVSVLLRRQILYDKDDPPQVKRRLQGKGIRCCDKKL